MLVIDKKIQQRMVALRRDLHQHPELSWNEKRTATKVSEFLDELEISYRSGVAGTGIVAEIPGQCDGPTIALRADMDALPIKEETGLPFASEVEGVMHACGHDGHISILLGAAMHLSQQSPPPLPVRLIFQPAEEMVKGAKAMIREGVLEDVAVIFGGHLDRHYQVGNVIVSDGPVNASSDKFRIEISGQGAHAARPHESVDAVVVGSLLVIAIQTIVSREVNPAHPSVVSVGRFDAGTAANVIAGHAVLEGSIRAQDPEVRDYLHKAIQRIADAVGQLHDAEVKVDIIKGTPPVINSHEMAELARQAAAAVIGESHVGKLATANMGGEDFSYYLQQVPGCYVRIGGQVPGHEGFPAHSSRFDFDEHALSIGAAYFVSLVTIASDWLLQRQ